METTAPSFITYQYTLLPYRLVPGDAPGADAYNRLIHIESVIVNEVTRRLHHHKNILENEDDVRNMM